MKLGSLALLGGMLMSSLASAAMVEVTFDVTISGRGIGQLTEGGWDFAPGDTFVPQTFSLVARFDPDNSHSPATYVSENPFSSSVNWSWASPSLSQSPFTQAFRNMVPGLNPSLDINTARQVDELEDGSMFQEDYFSTSIYAESNSNPFAAAFYGQDLSLMLNRGLGSRDNTDPLGGDELVSLLQASIGKTYFGDYMEFYANVFWEQTQDGYRAVAIDAQYLMGDVTIRSVQAVPVPGAAWLLGSGLMVLAATRKAKLQRR